MLSLLAMVSKSLALLTSAGLSLKRVSSSGHGERIQRQNTPLTCLVGNLNSVCLGSCYHESGVRKRLERSGVSI